MPYTIEELARHSMEMLEAACNRNGVTVRQLAEALEEASRHLAEEQRRQLGPAGEGA